MMISKYPAALLMFAVFLTGNPARALAAGDGNDPALAQKIRAVRDVAADFAQPPQGIPPEILNKAEAVLIFSNVIRGGFLFAGTFGHGAALLRDRDGKWSQPAFFRISGGAFGLLAGGQVSDVVVIVNTREALETLLDHHFTMGADLSATAGVGGGVNALGNIRAAVVSYARTRGLFAGVSLDGAVIKEDTASNQRYYGKPLSARNILIENQAAPTAAGQELIEALDTGLFRKT